MTDVCLVKLTFVGKPYTTNTMSQGRPLQRALHESVLAHKANKRMLPNFYNYERALELNG